tara:strand:- start:820 stop:1032 length:213 start_codon:yes stop_codon:yes gene_type:complete
MNEKIKWEDVTSYEKLQDYIRDVIGEENCYDELFMDLLHGMIYNREQERKQEKINKKLSNMGGIVMPNGK